MRRWLAAALGLSLAACAAHRVDVAILSSPSDQVVWEAAQDAVKRKDWEAARQYLKRLVDGFAQSPHQPDARLALADTYFEEGGTANYVLAASAYHEFLTLYPLHPRSDYAQFRAGECYFKQKNSPDRDQTSTVKAMEEYQKLLDLYPESSEVEPARQRIHECRQILARSNQLVAWFYQRGRQAWRAAISRYETVLRDYPEYDKTDEVLYRLAQCLAAAGRYAEALPNIGRLEKDFPNSPYVARAKELQASFPAAAPAPPAAAPAPPPTGAEAAGKVAPPPSSPPR